MTASDELAGRVAIVTGGASGVGAACARTLAAAGATVVIGDVQDDLGARIARDIGPRASFRTLDVSSEASRTAVIDDTMGRFGRLDILVNNAGIVGGTDSIEDTTVEAWERTHAVNLDGVFLGCNSVHPGGIDTPIFNPLWQRVGREPGKAVIDSLHPLGHMGEPDDIAEAVLYLVSDRAKFVTGAELVADGGITSGIQRRMRVAPP